MHGKTGSLNSLEKRIVKRLCAQGWRNQDILALINSFRPKTVNPARVAGVKVDVTRNQATDDEYLRYRNFKRAFDSRTGLNPFLDERLIRSREAMKLAVHVFNNPTVIFRAEAFSVLSIIAWTYLVHEYSRRNGLPTNRTNGSAISLADFLKGADCPFSEAMKHNLKAMIKLRNSVEHRMMGPFDQAWISLFQANAVNYERVLVENFGSQMSLADELSFALQFSGVSLHQAEAMVNSELPVNVQSLSAELTDGLSEDQRNDPEFKFSVIYTTVSASKSKAAVQFLHPDSEEAEVISNVLIKLRPSSETHPFLATQVVKEVRARSGKNFSLTDHTKAWKKYNVRPGSGSAKPEITNGEYCYYNPTYKRHSYNEAWVKKLCDEWV